ncbi:hypothetical protein [Halalkalibacter urbisdiaboli]|uniref:hypothetical protein n=1 Tax=Halalkalibacter urbisdiaboli TaxID=1960589 RepID=UPI000B42E50C|nr:hypothetical protein [Halalkalibacter urbisdiaboli]
MSSGLLFIIAVVVLVVVAIVLSLRKSKSSAETHSEDNERSCKQCGESIPFDYDKSLCPHCNKFLM